MAFPEQQPFSSTGPLALFNGGVKHGVTTMFIHADVSVPTPTAIVTVVKIKKILRQRQVTGSRDDPGQRRQPHRRLDPAPLHGVRMIVSGR